MMKHVQLSPFRSRADTVSISSTTSYGSLSPEPLGSRSSSYSSLSESVTSHSQPPKKFDIQDQNSDRNKAIICDSFSLDWRTISHSAGRELVGNTTIKVYAKCLRPDIEYKTLSITFQTTCKEVVSTLLSKYKMKHRDPKLFYLSMEVTVRKAGVRTHLPLDEEARPAVLQSCHPKGDSKFSLQTRRGGLVKVYDSALNSNSQYKSLLISARTTVDELINLLLICSNSKERVEQFSLYEVCTDKEQQRKLHPDDRPLQVQATWLPTLKCHFLIRRNPDYLPLSRRKFYWAPGLPTVPQSRPAQNPAHFMQLSKSQSSLLNTKKQEDKTNKINNNLSTSTELKSVVANNNQITKVSGSPPSYADYENYFYI